MLKNLPRVFFLLLLISFFSSQKTAAQLQSVYDQLVVTNPLWANIQDIDPALKTNAATPLNEQQLIQQHLQEVEKLLRKRSTSTLSAAAKKSREINLNTLHAYCLNGVFPINTLHEGRQPYFIDDNNTYCAVGYLMKINGGDAIAKDIHKTQNFSYLADIHHPQLMDWVANSGLSFDELALIQPGYGGETPPYISEMHYIGQNTGEYIELMQCFGMMVPFTDVLFYNHSGALYKTLNIDQMHTVLKNGRPSGFYSYHFLPTEDFPDSGKIVLAYKTKYYSSVVRDTVRYTDTFAFYTYNSQGISVNDRQTGRNRNFLSVEDNTTPVDYSLNFCGKYIDNTWSAHILPVTTDSVNGCIIIPTPIRLSSFSSVASNKSVLLNWQTASENNTDHFEIERSIDGISFTSIGKINASAISSSSKTYSFDDNSPNYINHYRLKIVDRDGNFTYSKIVYVKNTWASQLTLQQNIVTDRLRFEVKTDQSTIGEITVYDLFGKRYSKIKPVSGSNYITTSALAAGAYLIRLSTKDGQVFTQQFIKQ